MAGGRFRPAVVPLSVKVGTSIEVVDFHIQVPLPPRAHPHTLQTYTCASPRAFMTAAAAAVACRFLFGGATQSLPAAPPPRRLRPPPLTGRLRPSVSQLRKTAGAAPSADSTAAFPAAITEAVQLQVITCS